jgi:exopolysaccharide biosynthesis WecB/TagA/CpsF family protein
MTWSGHVEDVTSTRPALAFPHPGVIDRLSATAVRGLTEMYDPRSRSFPRTVRGGRRLLRPVAEGMSVRYTAIAALGLSRMDVATRTSVLVGHDVVDILPGVLGLALAGRDQGAIALSVWAAAEVAKLTRGITRPTRPDAHDTAESDRTARALDRLLMSVRTEAPVPTVDHAWTLAALLAAISANGVASLDEDGEQVVDAARRAADRLLAAQAPNGLFPHYLPVGDLSRFRSHVGCFADQVYPIQALARYALGTGDADALAAADRCAERLVALQGPEGQWWWHYDWRYGSVVERYPVYSVHQHAMAPMAFRELHEAGGRDHRAAVESGLLWVLERPETAAELIEDDLGVVWRKVGRREPRKVVRKVRSAVSAARPELRLSWLDQIFPADTVDRECRPYELGWLLYAWHEGAASAAPARPDGRQDVAVTLPRARTRVSPDATRRIFGLTMDAQGLDEVEARCREALIRRERILLGILDARTALGQRSERLFRDALLDCDLVLPAARPVVWASRLAGGRPVPERVDPVDLTDRLLRLARDERQPIYLLGGGPDLLPALAESVCRHYPGLVVAGSRAADVVEGCATTVADEIRASGAGLLLAGLASPAKESFLTVFGSGLGVPILCAVGGPPDLFAHLARRIASEPASPGRQRSRRLARPASSWSTRSLRSDTVRVTRAAREQVRPLPVARRSGGDGVVDLGDAAG